MNTFIALLRGVNIGGNNKLPMKELAALLAGAGLRDVRTYIQSGNVMFRAVSKDRAVLAAKISGVIKERLGFAPRVLLLDAAELRRVMANNPFPEAEGVPGSLHVLFLLEAPRHPDLEQLEALKAAGESFKLVGKVFYLYAPAGVGRSKLAACAEKLLGVPVTGRNWNTVRELAELAAAKKAA